MSQDFTKGDISSQILRFTLPMLLGNIFQQLYNVIDSIIVGNVLGKEALAAVGASFPIIFALISLTIGIGSGFTVVVSQFFGAKEYSNVRKTVATMHIFLFVAGIITSIFAAFYSRQIFVLLDVPAELLEDASTYLRIYMMGMVLFFGFSGTSSVLRGLGDSKTPLYFLIFSTLSNIVLDLFFILVLGLGVEGVAYATILSQGIALLALSVYVHRKNKLIRLTSKTILFDWTIFFKAFKIGLPSGIQHISVSLGIVLISRLVNGFGTNVIAAYTVAMRIDSLAVMPAMAFSQAVASFTGQNIGAREYGRVEKGFTTTLFQSLLVCLCMTAIIMLFGENLLRLFGLGDEEEVLRIGKEYLVIVSAFYTLFVVLFISNGTLRGAGDTFIPMCITIVALWLVRIPLAYVLSDWLAERGIWWSIPAGWFVGAVLSSIYYKMGYWKKKNRIVD